MEKNIKSEPKMIVVIGGKAIGKTHETLKFISQYISPFGKENKVLIFDVNEEFSNERLESMGVSFKTNLLDVKDIETYSNQNRVEVRRVMARDENGNRLSFEGKIELLNKILYDFKDGLLILEDYSSYVFGASGTGIINQIFTNRHRNLDVIIHLQSYSNLTPRMIQNCDIMRLHRCVDMVKRVEARLPNPEIHLISESLINFKYRESKRFMTYIDMGNSKISGDFTKEEYTTACSTYMEENKHKMRNRGIENLMDYYGNN